MIAHQTYPSASSLCSVCRRLAKEARIHPNNHNLFVKDLKRVVQSLRDRDRRATGSKPSRRLIEAAEAARTLEKNIALMPKKDIDWVEHISNTETTRKSQFASGEVADLASTVSNISSLLNDALGRPSSGPDHQFSETFRTQNVKDQLLRELLFGLLSAASNHRGKFTFRSDSVSGSLATGLDLLRPHLPKGLVPPSLSAATIRRLKADFGRLSL